MKKYLSRGFTLIELLVVIAIIGILAGIILTSLGTARMKAKDARVIASVNQIRNIAEMNYTSAYGDFTASSDYTALNTDIGLQGGALTTAGTNSTAACLITTGACSGYRSYATLPTNPANAWCVDSSSNSTQVIVTSLPTTFPLKCK